MTPMEIIDFAKRLQSPIRPSKKLSYAQRKTATCVESNIDTKEAECCAKGFSPLELSVHQEAIKRCTCNE